MTTESNDLLARFEPFCGAKIMEIGCRAGSLACAICGRLGPKRYVAVDVRDRLAKETRNNMPADMEYIVTDSYDGRYNPRGKGVKVPTGKFDTILGNGWLIHVPMEDFSPYVEVFANRLKVGGYLALTCFIDGSRHGQADRKNIHAFYSEEWLQQMHPRLKVCHVERGGWTTECWAPHDLVVWQKE